MQFERRLIARLKTANIRFTDAQVERIFAIVSSHQAGLSIRKIAGATGLSSSRIHQFSTRPKPRRFQSGRANRAEVPVERKKPNCLSRKPRSDPVWREKLRYCERCTDWLQRLQRGENVVVNLRPDEDFETEFVAFDRKRVVRVLKRIAADLDTLQRGAE